MGERGASAAKQKLKPSGSSDWTSERGVAVRFGSASFASLVISFCWQKEVYLLAESFPCSMLVCVFLPAGEGFSFAGRVPLSLRL